MPKIYFLLSLLFFSAVVSNAFAQSDSITNGSSYTYRVGVYSQPPYMITDENGNWDGISLNLWRATAEKMGIKYKLVEVPKDSAVNVLLQQQADIVLLEDVTAEAEKLIDFSHIYHIAKMGVASSENISLSSIAKAFFNKQFWYTAGTLSILLLIIGTIIYFVERKTNDANFGGDRSIVKGIGSGFWWAGVTMTTIGYGDKAPVTFWGRVVALIWMLVAMAVTAVLTASLISAVLGDSAENLSVPGGLRNMKMVAVEGSYAANYLEKQQILYEKVPEISKALEAVKNNNADALLNSVPLMRYTINNDSRFSLKVQPVNINPHYYAFGLRQDDSIRERLNEAVLEVINSSLWEKQLDKYVPEKTK